MVQQLSLNNTKKIIRQYGFIFSLADINTGLKNIQISLMEVNPKERTSKHYHPFEEVFFIIKGISILECQNKNMVLKKNDIAIINPNEIHQIINKSRIKNCLILVIMSPPRDPKKVVYCD